jgi:hypothetical protein
MHEIEMDTDESNQLIRIVAGLYQFEGHTGRQRLIAQAGVFGILKEVDLTGEASNVAWEIIRRLQAYGPMPNDHHVHALGALLRHVLTLGDLPQGRAKSIAGLVVKHSLVEDPNYIQQLSTRYDITPGQKVAFTSAALSDSERQQFHQALISAFPPQGALSQMVNLRFDQDLTEIAGTGTLDEVVADLITWAEASRKVEDLIRKARAQNPTDPLLNAFAERMLPGPRVMGTSGASGGAQG